MKGVGSGMRRAGISAISMDSMSVRRKLAKRKRCHRLNAGDKKAIAVGIVVGVVVFIVLGAL